MKSVANAGSRGGRVVGYRNGRPIYASEQGKGRGRGSVEPAPRETERDRAQARKQAELHRQFEQEAREMLRRKASIPEAKARKAAYSIKNAARGDIVRITRSGQGRVHRGHLGRVLSRTDGGFVVMLPSGNQYEFEEHELDIAKSSMTHDRIRGKIRLFLKNMVVTPAPEYVAARALNAPLDDLQSSATAKDTSSRLRADQAFARTRVRAYVQPVLNRQIELKTGIASNKPPHGKEHLVPKEVWVTHHRTGKKFRRTVYVQPDSGASRDQKRKSVSEERNLKEKGEAKAADFGRAQPAGEEKQVSSSDSKENADSAGAGAKSRAGPHKGSDESSEDDPGSTPDVLQAFRRLDKMLSYSVSHQSDENSVVVGIVEKLLKNTANGQYSELDKRDLLAGTLANIERERRARIRPDTIPAEWYAPGRKHSRAEQALSNHIKKASEHIDHGTGKLRKGSTTAHLFMQSVDGIVEYLNEMPDCARRSDVLVTTLPWLMDIYKFSSPR